jgi:hypothetical protein
MNIQAEKLAIVKMILDTENPDILESIKRIFTKQAKVDFWSTLSEEEKEDVKIGLSEVEKDELVDYDEFISKHR